MAQLPELNNTLSVSQITGHIQHTLEQDYGNVWVKGEISNLTRHSSGHWYFSLKDSGAQLGSVMFSRQNQSVRVEITHGMEVTAHGRISVYAPQGRYQLIVDQMLPAGQGDLHLAFEALKKKLDGQGLFDPTRKQALPPYPDRVGIVTSPTGAAIRDMINILSRRFPLAELLLIPVKVQGEGAAAEIAHAIEIFNQRQDCQVLIIGRGGGSLEDLWAFNEEVVARAIAGSSIPIVSAVGHETDTTISDFVADRRAPTPSAAAELAVPDKIELDNRLSNLGQRLQKNILNRVERHEQRLNAIQGSYALKRPVLMINQASQRLDNMQDHSLRMVKEKIGNYGSKLDGFEQQVKALNPLSVLVRGFAVLSKPDGKIIRSVNQLKVGDQVQVRLSDGEVQSTIDSLNSKKK
ncbi:exodeoxyribonuclease VII large subunit [bacterium]|nr:exodeoxyribonuclease VII large subunit [bacterium]